MLDIVSNPSDLKRRRTGPSLALTFIEGTKGAQARDETAHEHRSYLQRATREIRGAKEKRDISLRRLDGDGVGTPNG